MKPIRFFAGLKIGIAALALACSATASLAAPGNSGAARESMRESTQKSADVPPALQAWRDWVRHEQEFRQCPLIHGGSGESADDFLCLWPGVLTLEAGDKGATFTQRWQVAAPSWTPLPGDSRNWPQEVTVNGAPQPVVAREGVPSLWLAAGDYAVRGRIAWQERPQALTVPSISALIALRVDGKPVAPLQRDGDWLTLGRSAVAAGEEADSLELQVYRKFTDGIPAQLTTRLQLKVSGKAREIQIAPALPEHFVATALASPWPARLDAQGRLQVQVQPGQAALVLSARADAPLAQLQTRPPQQPQAIEQEVWSYEALPALRVTAVTPGGGALAVDPKQAGVPPEWQALPAFAMNAEACLAIEERSRGLAADETNRLTLARELWLDFSGDGYFAKDTLRGQMRQGWRLDVAAPYRLQRATGGGEALLVTHGEGGQDGGSGAALTGVEWRSRDVLLEASVRIAAGPSSALPVTGWRQTFDRVDARLHLPYGYKLLAAPGADAVNDGWLARWTILDVFLAAFIALLAWRLLGAGGGVAAAAYLLLALQEAGAPVWTLTIALAVALLCRALPGGRLGKFLRWTHYAALALFCLTAIGFAPGQLRAALYPQLEPADGYSPFSGVFVLGHVVDGDAAPVAAPAPSPEPALADMAPDELAKPAAPAAKVRSRHDRDDLPRQEAMLKESGSKAAYLKKEVQNQQRYAQSNVVQTGGGEPDWRIGQNYTLSWTGPILAEQTVRFIISPPWLTRLLRVAMIALLGWLVWRVLRRIRPDGGKPARVPPLPQVVATAALTVLTVAALWLPATPASAQEPAAFPPKELLQSLRERVNRPPRCAPECASIARADIDMRGNTLTLRLQAHAATAVALPLPRAQDNATLLRARIDGQPADNVLRGDMADWAPLPRGVHLVELEYAVAGGDTALHFTLPPMRAVFSGQGWQMDGIDEDRLINQTVHLARTATGAKEQIKDGGAQQFPPYVRVTRTLRFALDWSVESTVARLSPREGGVTLAVPLLAGEHVTTPGIKVQGGEATVSLGQSEAQTGWQARLDKSDTLILTAPALIDRAEVWRVEVGPSWHVRWDGAPVMLAANDEGETVFEFRPLPGETLTLTPVAPVPVDGMVRAIDRVRLEHAIGMRASEHTLSFTLRASQGGEHAIALPAGMEVLRVQRGGESLNLRPQDGKLTLPVTPGVQTFTIALREAREPGALLDMPVFDLGLPAANIDLNVTLPEQRWLLAAFGPRVGPALLYWGELAVALALAFLLTQALTRRGWTSLRPHHWFLLALGFSTFSWGALALIVCWLLALDWRQRAPVSAWKTWQFNGVQIGLALLSLAALICLFTAIPAGLLGHPDMGVAGHGSYDNNLNWFADQSAGKLPTITLVTLPLWAYRAAMLAWALWLAWSVIGWLRRGLAAWMRGGYWRKTSLPNISGFGKPQKTAADGERDS